MRKRFSVLILILVLTLAIQAGFAENSNIPTIREQFTMEQQPFSFRNGVQWGMTPELVRSVETEAMAERGKGEWSVMMTDEPVPVSRFTADLIFIFQNQTLKMITYEFQKDATILNYQYLIGALTSVYGEAQDASSETIKQLMDLIYPDRFRTEWIREQKVWNYSDGTHIYLYYFADSNYAILYTSPEFSAQYNGYEINGL